tara:strand:- start:267 stop:911 length:645 start_codon:yes stop_codon:yes gene_type:complete
MAVTRNIRSIWITDYDKSIGDISNYLASGSGSDPITTATTHDRSTITGTTEIIKDGYFWGQSEASIPLAVAAADLDEDLTAGETTVETDDGTYFSASGGYILIENEIIQYTGKSTDDLTGCTRGALDTTDVQHDGTAGTIGIYIYQRGVVQSIDYEPEDEVYAVRVALGATLDGPGYIVSYFIYRFEFSKHVVDLVNYTDTENPTTISGTIPGY